MKKLLIPLFLAISLPVYANIEFVDIMIHNNKDFYTKAGKTEHIGSVHHLRITNETPKWVTYSITFQICPDDHTCKWDFKTWQLGPGCHETFNLWTDAYFHYKTPGIRTVKAITIIIRPEKDYPESKYMEKTAKIIVGE